MTYSRLEISSSSHFWQNEDTIALTKDFPYVYNANYPHLKRHPALEEVMEVLKEDLGDVELVRYRSFMRKRNEKKTYEPTHAVIKMADVAALLVHFEGSGSVALFCFSKEKDLPLPAFNHFMEDLTEIPEGNDVRWSFVFKTIAGFQTYNRKIPCPSLEEVENNYTNIERLRWLINLKKPYDNGKLIFWYGVPGTGKTYAIRALANEWKNAEFLYITQPESFFSDFGGMYSVVLEHCNAPISEEDDSENFKVLVIEDALDLLLKESRMKDSPTISRLLNLTEGIIGQGLRLLVLITSNEPATSIDDAFTRPGRCLQRVEFKPFNREEAANWLKMHDVNGGIRPTDSMTLAQLYEVISKGGEGIEPVSSKKAGFR